MLGWSDGRIRASYGGDYEDVGIAHLASCRCCYGICPAQDEDLPDGAAAIDKGVSGQDVARIRDIANIMQETAGPEPTRIGRSLRS